MMPGSEKTAAKKVAVTAAYMAHTSAMTHSRPRSTMSTALRAE
jgi:hypothetical protein